jgi:hypothetical protein
MSRKGLKSEHASAFRASVGKGEDVLRLMDDRGHLRRPEFGYSLGIVPGDA